MAVVARDALEPVRLGLHRMQRMLANRRSWTSLAEAAGADLPQQAIQVLQHLQDGSPKSVAEHGAGNPMGRPGQPEEVSPAFVFFASEADSSYITGEVLTVNGADTSAA